MSPQTAAFLAKIQPHTRLACLNQSREICTLQRDLFEFAAERFVLDDLEQKWQDLTQNRREELVLEGIWRAAHVGPDLESYREWCPDITVKNLAGNTTNGFLQLVQRLMPPDLESDLKEPIKIPHPVVDQLLRVPQNFRAKGTADNEQLPRCYFITMTLWQIMLAFVGGAIVYIRGVPLYLLFNYSMG